MTFHDSLLAKARHALDIDDARQLKQCVKLMQEMGYPRSLTQIFTSSKNSASIYTKATDITSRVSIVICVHNALRDVRRCIESVEKNSPHILELIIVNDGSDEATSELVENTNKNSFLDTQLITNQAARGYTCAANQGIQASRGDFVVLLNSDTVTTEGWLEELVNAATKSPATGIVGPLSNTASWQSIPKVFDSPGEWASNPINAYYDINNWSKIVKAAAFEPHPKVFFLNGFCMLIKRETIDSVGIFDEESFARGYGEENDYCIRAIQKGWDLRVCQKSYVYHAQSKSYSHEKRKELADHAGLILNSKYGAPLVADRANHCKNHPQLHSLRERLKAYIERDKNIAMGKKAHEGMRILIFLPVADAGGGANVVMKEAESMTKMGVFVTIANDACNQDSFSLQYSHFAIPTIYYTPATDLSEFTGPYDAVIATANTSAKFLLQVPNSSKKVYYIQDYEPWFYSGESAEYREAVESYSLLPGCICHITKTRWNRAIVEKHTPARPNVIGCSLDIDNYYPSIDIPGGESQSLHIVAMVRLKTPRRNPTGTIKLLSQLHDGLGRKIRFSVFGVENIDHVRRMASGLGLQDIAIYPHINSEDIRDLLSECDVFIDNSHYQAMGLTALEAMACGVIPIVSSIGGAKEFILHESNGFLFPCDNYGMVQKHINKLVQSPDLLAAMKINAITTANSFYPEKAALNILNTIFP